MNPPIEERTTLDQHARPDTPAALWAACVRAWGAYVDCPSPEAGAALGAALEALRAVVRCSKQPQMSCT